MNDKSILGEIGSVAVETKNEVNLKLDYKSIAIAVIIIIAGASAFLILKKMI